MKHNFKRLLSFVLALAMCMSMVWVPAFAEEGVTTDPKNPATFTTMPRIAKKDGVIEMCPGQETDFFSVNNSGSLYSGYQRTKGQGVTISKKNTITLGSDIKIIAANDATSSTIKIKSSTILTSCNITVTIREHVFEEYFCTADGKEVAECKHGCGATNTRAYTGKATHTLDLENPVRTIEPTCVEKGHPVYKCSVCSREVTGKETDIDPDAHVWGDLESNNDATCAKDGTKSAACKNGCGKKSDPEPDEGSSKKVPHTWPEEGILIEDPADPHYGDTLYTCTVCGSTKYSHVHIPGQPVDIITEPVTCLNPGKKDVVTYCTVCNDPLSKESEVIPIDVNAHYGKRTESKEDFNEKEGCYYDVVTYAGCGHKIRTKVELTLDPLAPQETENDLTTKSDDYVGLDTAIHAGQKLVYKIKANGDGKDESHKISIVNGSAITLKSGDKQLQSGSTVKLSSAQATEFIITANHTNTKKVVSVKYEFSTDGFLGTGIGARKSYITIKVTINPHDTISGFTIEHPATCTENGKKSTDTFCKVCGYSTTGGAM